MTTDDPGLPAPFTLVALDDVDSTNDEIRRRALGGAPHGTLVWAKAQTKGRGRRARNWVSEPGNLYLSILLRDVRPLSKAAQLAFVASLAVADALAAIAPPGTDVGCKWPNDVLIEKKKVCGILLETGPMLPGGLEAEWIVAGIGVNVAHCPTDTAFPATSLAAEGFGEVDLQDLLRGISHRFQHWMAARSMVGFAAVRQAWLRRAVGLDQPIVARLAGGEEKTGIFAGVAGDGALILRTDGQEDSMISAGEVFFQS